MKKYLIHCSVEKIIVIFYHKLSYHIICFLPKKKPGMSSILFIPDLVFVTYTSIQSMKITINVDYILPFRIIARYYQPIMEC